MQAHVQRRLAAVLLVASVPLLAGGCSQLSGTQRGAIIGAAGGAAVGAAVGNATGSTARGAIIGAAVGGVAGAIIGRRMDQQAEELALAIPGATVQRVGEGIVVTFDSGILFDFDRSDLRPEARQNLANLAASLNKYPDTEILLVGHTDNVGTDSYNQSLSERRALAARDYLVAQGVAAARIRAVGRGESEPIATNDTDAGRQQNRRVEVAIFAGEELRRSATSGAD
ncbi:MAG TPA: OmpA family protein [Longimicrobiales bacterium]|nr:OmpA family protein [Longimicrobiales bacterium]